jgi:hypothetical protein
VLTVASTDQLDLGRATVAAPVPRLGQPCPSVEDVSTSPSGYGCLYGRSECRSASLVSCGERRSCRLLRAVALGRNSLRCPYGQVYNIICTYST